MTMLYAPAAPVRSLDQRMEALARANDIRVKRAELKRKVKVGAVDVAVMLADPPQFVETMKVFDLLLAMPKTGAVKAQRIMRALSISSSKTVSGLSTRQRDAIVRELTGR